MMSESGERCKLGRTKSYKNILERFALMGPVDTCCIRHMKAIRASGNHLTAAYDKMIR